MILLFLFFLAVVNPYIYYMYFNNYNKKRILINKNNNLSKYNIYIKSSNFGNPFDLITKFKLNIIFELPENFDKLKLIENDTLISQEYNLNENKINFTIYNRDLNKIHSFIQNVYPTYSRINFIYYEKTPYVNILLKNEIDKFNLDTTRNYNMLNLYIIALFYDYNKNYIDKNKLINIDHSKNYINDILIQDNINYLYDILL